MKTILVFTSFYLPGYKSGGPLRTISNMVEHLKDEFSFKIVTSDRDSGDKNQYPNVSIGEWSRVGDSDVFYMPPEMQNISGMYQFLKSTEYDLIYLNSFFAFRFTIIPLFLRKISNLSDCPIVLAPRGEFSPGALAIKKVKKALYLKLAKVSLLYNHIVWQASSEMEELDIRRVFGSDIDLCIALDLPPKTVLPLKIQSREKIVGALRIVFISRISPKKNLDGALKLLKNILGDISFDIYGPIDDAAYWDKCLEIINDVQSENVMISYRGTITHDEVYDTFGQYDLFLFPTHGENYGHVIHESLVAGCPVLLSDQTPWQDFEENRAGWVCSHKDLDSFRAVILKCLEMNKEEHLEWSKGASLYGSKVSMDAGVVEQNRELFRFALQK